VRTPLKITSPADGEVYLHGQEVVADFFLDETQLVVTRDTAELTSPSGDVSAVQPGDHLDTTRAGVWTMSLSALDEGGNPVSLQVSFTVLEPEHDRRRGDAWSRAQHRRDHVAREPRPDQHRRPLGHRRPTRQRRDPCKACPRRTSRRGQRRRPATTCSGSCSASRAHPPASSRTRSGSTSTGRSSGTPLWQT
jgi:hypothetical protein